MRSSCSAPQNMNSAMNTTSSTTTPVGSLSHWSSVKRPMYDEYQKSSNSPTVSPKAKMPNVELLLEADDRLSSTLYWNQGLVGVGYWVDSLAAGDDVASAVQPYRLVRFD